MSKKRSSLIVTEDLSNIFADDFEDKQAKVIAPKDGLPIATALKTVIRQMEVSGLRPRTIADYERHVMHFVEITGAQVIEELTVDHIYTWLSSMRVSNQTKLTRLKCLKAFLTRCFYNGWMSTNFWRQVNIKVATPVKEGATEQDVHDPRIGRRNFTNLKN